MAGTLHYRARFRDPFDTVDTLVVSTVPTDANPYITDPPEGDGTSVDILTGKVAVGEYVIRIADEVGTIQHPTLLFEENWDYVSKAARDAVWIKTTDQAAAFAGGDNAGWDVDGDGEGNDLHVGITYGGGLGGGGGYGKHTYVVTGLTAGETYTVICDRMTLSRALGGLDDCGIALNGGEGANCFDNGVLDGPVYVSGVATGAGELTITCGHFDLEYGMDGIVITIGPLRILGPTTPTVTRVVTGWLGDEDARWQVLGSRAYVEESPDVGANWVPILGAYVQHVELVGGIQYEITIGESDRRERQAQVFAVAEGEFEAAPLIGGPLGFAGQLTAPVDTWLFRVSSTGDTDSSLPDDAVVLDFTHGWAQQPADGELREMFGSIDADIYLAINRIAQQFASDDGGLYTLDGLTAQVYTNVSGAPGALVGTFTPYGVSPFPFFDVADGVGKYPFLLNGGEYLVLKWGYDDGGTLSLPAVDTYYQLTVTPEIITEDSPAHYEGHPVDYVREMLDLRAIAYDATSADDVKTALGQMRVFYRKTTAESVMDAAENDAFGPFGFAIRPTPAGEWEFFLTRTLPASEPSEVLTASDVHDPETVTFALDAKSMVNRIVWKQTQWSTWTEQSGGDRPADGVVGGEVNTVVTPDTAAIADVGSREITYTLPGMLVIKADGSPKIGGTKAWMIQAGTEILRRFERGCPTAEVKALRGTAAAVIGEFLIVDLAHRPNIEDGRTPTSQRGNERVVQVIHRTLTPAGPELEVLDYGPNVTAGTVPAFTLALTSDDPQHTAQVTLTNSGALLADDVLVRIEMGTGTVEPDGGMTVDVITPDALAHRLFSQEAGTTVWARMRAEPIGGGIPSAWSAWQSIALDALDPVTGLANDAGATCTEQVLTWTVGDALLEVRVRWKETAASTYTGQAILPAGSNTYTIAGLTPGTAYTAAVDHLDVDPYSGDSADATTTWTACGTTPTLNPPIDPLCFVEPGGVYGQEVTGTEFPSNVVFEEAIETAAGAGTFAAYAVVLTTPTVAGRIRYESTRANDGKLVRIRAKHTRSGWTDSAYADFCELDPWGDPDIPPTGALQSITDSVVVWSGGIGGTIELTGITNGRLALQYSLDGATGWDFLDGTAGPYVILNDTGMRRGDWAVPEAAFKTATDAALRVVTVTAGGTAALFDVSGRLWKIPTGIKHARIGADVVTASSFSVDPVIANVWVEFNAAITAADPPPDPEPPAGLVSSCSALDTYPVERGLIAWHICDCGTFDEAANPDEVKTLTDLSGSGNTLNPTGDEAISGAVVTRDLTTGAVSIPTLNGRRPISFKDAWLPWPTSLFTGMTEGELFIVVRGFQTDPTNDRFYCWTLGTHTGATNQPYWGQGTGAANTGIIKEDFGSSTLRDLGDAPGSTVGSFRIYNVRAAAGHFVAALDGTDFFTTGTNTVAFSTAPKMGSRSENSQILIAEIAIHNVVLTADERASVVAALEARWAL